MEFDSFSGEGQDRGAGREVATSWTCDGAAAACEIQKRFAQAMGDRSNAEVSRLTGFHPEAIRRYRLGRTPPASLLAAMCDKLGVSAEWLLLGRGPTFVPPQAS